MDPLELSCNLTIAGEDAASDHVVRRVGPDAISITSASAAAETELRSIYIGAGKNPQVLVAERSTVGSQPALLASRWMDAAEGVVNYAPAQCLCDHLQHVQDLAEENLGSPDGVSGLERAEAQLRLGLTT